MGFSYPGRRSKNTTNNIQHKTQHMSRHCLDIDWDIRHWNIFLNIFWIYLKKDEKKEEKSGSAGDRTHGGGRVPLCCLTLYRLRHRTYTFEKSKNTSYVLCTQCCMLHSMSFVVLFVECWMLYINVATYVETLDSLVCTNTEVREI